MHTRFSLQSLRLCDMLMYIDNVKEILYACTSINYRNNAQKRQCYAVPCYVNSRLSSSQLLSSVLRTNLPHLLNTHLNISNLSAMSKTLLGLQLSI